MAVEKLIANRIEKIGDLQVVEQRAEGNALRLYRRLLESPLWDPGREEWRRSMNENESNVNNSRATDDQLIGVLVETIFNINHARDRYSNLKRMPFFDDTKSLWSTGVDGDLITTHDSTWTKDQLLGVLAEAAFNKNSALERFTLLQREHLLYGTRLWPARLDSIYHEFHAEEQLLSVLITGLSDKDKAEAEYLRLMQSQLYDAERNQWIGSLQKPMRYSGDQLLGILVAGMFDRKNAAILYKNLKDTPLFDKHQGLWIGQMDEDQSSFGATRFTGDQLLGVLVEKMFEEEDVYTSQVDEVPVVRKF